MLSDVSRPILIFKLHCTLKTRCSILTEIGIIEIKIISAMTLRAKINRRKYRNLMDRPIYRVLLFICYIGMPRSPC